MQYVFYGLIIVALGFVGFLFLGKGGADTTSSQSANPLQDSKVIKYSASITNRSYSPERIDVPFGATVELTIKNNDNEQHGFSLFDFGVSDFVGPLQTKTDAHGEELIINII